METEIYIGVGSNINPMENISQAMGLLSRRVQVTGTSKFYQTSPVDRPGQPDFLNGVWKVSFDASAKDLKFQVLRKVEEEIGRVRSEDPSAARPIDLDIILYGVQESSVDGLEIPCPDIASRPFVAVPLFELAGNIEVPGLGARLGKIVEALDSSQMKFQEEFSGELAKRIAL